jgi:hypothetical protein
MRAVSSSAGTLFNHFFGDGFEVSYPAHVGTKVNEDCGVVEQVDGEFGSFVVVGEGVMIVVPGFAYGEYGKDAVVY